MQVSHFPAAAANSLIEGYCDDFVALAAVLSQTLEQVSMRDINITGSRPALARIENGMRALAEAIHELLDRGPMPVNVVAPAQTASPPATPPARPAGAPPSPSPSALRASAPSRQPSPSSTTTSTPQPRLPAQPRLRQSSPARPPARPQQTTASATTNSTAAPNANAAPRRATDAGDLRGTNASMPLLSVFQFIERTRKSGVLTVQLPDETITFEIASGCVQSCASTAQVRGERLGDLIVAAGIADQQAIEMVARGLEGGEDRLSSKRFGSLLVERALMTNGQLVEQLEAQARRRFRRACDTPSASYAFATCDPTTSDGRMRLAPMELNHRPSWEVQS